MIRFYSLFVTDNNLLASPFVGRLNLFHDLTLHLDREESVNFLLQTRLTTEQCSELNIIFDPLSVKVSNVETKQFRHQTLVTVTLIPREIGSLKLGLAFPQSKEAHAEKMGNLPSTLVSTPCRHIHQPNYLSQSARVRSYVG
mgnify:CR=1 FL=1